MSIRYGELVPNQLNLSDREWDVFHLIAQGQDNIEIATRLGISVDTVKTHVRRLLRDCEVRNRMQVAVLAWQRYTRISNPFTLPEELAERQREVISLALRGLTNRQIGKKLFIDEDTVKTHLRRAFKVLKIRSRLELPKRLVAQPPQP